MGIWHHTCLLGTLEPLFTPPDPQTTHKALCAPDVNDWMAVMDTESTTCGIPMSSRSSLALTALLEPHDLHQGPRPNDTRRLARHN